MPSPSVSQPACDRPLCVVCAEPAQSVAIGPCNHKEVCGLCHLRMRMCYNDTRCPLCKADVSKVLISPVRSAFMPNWDSFPVGHECLARSLWHRPQWNAGVYIDNTPPVNGHISAHTLSNELVIYTSPACPLCQPSSSRRSFGSMNQLTRHMHVKHQRMLCKICAEARRCFPCELVSYTSLELTNHTTHLHPHCKFCRLRFFDQDGLYAHIRNKHFSCQLCHAHDAPPVFATAGHLIEHMRRHHHLCEEPDCRDCLIAFCTREELYRHQGDRHSAVTSCQHRSNARLNTFEQHVNAHHRLAQRSSRAAQGQTQGAQARQHGGTPSARNQLQRTGSRLEMAGPGLIMIDDDRGLAEESNTYADANMPLIGTSGAHRVVTADEPFPSLAAANASSQHQGRRTSEVWRVLCGKAFTMWIIARRAQMQLTSQLLQCPCGRQKTRVAIAAGAPAAVDCLKCTKECAAVHRRAQLAAAFDVADPDKHIPWVDRNRTPTYTPDMQLQASAAPAEVQALERSLGLFLADTSVQRTALPPAPARTRALQHQLAAQYGLASHSTGSEPRRRVELVKVDRAAIPNRLLSSVALALSQEEVEHLTRTMAGHPLHFTQVTPGTDLSAILWRWAGSFTVEGPTLQGTAVARFSNKKALVEASDYLGGGLRGVLRVDRRT